MMSLSNTIKASSSVSADYYLKEESELSVTDDVLSKQNSTADYYISKDGGDIKQAQWFGKLAELQGFSSKEVTRDDFIDFLDGKIGDKEVHGAGKENRRQGYDLTFSAPKGASILALTYGDSRVSEAWESSVKQVLSEVEEKTAQIRNYDSKTKESTYTNTQNLAFALIRHQTSRDNDPQLHYHAIMGNITQNENGELQSLATCFKQDNLETNGVYERIMKDQKYYTAITHSIFASKLVEMGYSIKSVGKGMVDIDGIPDSVLKANSNRSEAIKNHVDELGFDSPKSRDIAAQATRSQKDDSKFDTLNDKWRARDAELGFDGVEFVKESYFNDKNDISINDANERKAVDLALEHISSYKNNFTLEKLGTLALTEFNSGNTLSISKIKSYVDDLMRDGSVLSLNENSTIFTAQSFLKKEESLIEATKSQVKGLGKTNDKNLVKNLSIPSDQKELIGGILESKKVTNIVNMKTDPYLFSELLLHVADNSKKNVEFITPDKLLSQENTIGNNRKSSGLKSWIINLSKKKEVSTNTVNSFINNTGEINKNKNNIVVVQYANLLNKEQVQGIIEKSVAINSKVIFLNQENSSKSFDGTDSIDILKKGNSNTFDWADAKVSNTKLDMVETDSKNRVKNIVDDLMTKGLDERDNIVVVAGSNKEVATINSMVRDRKEANNELGFKTLTTQVIKAVYLSDSQKTQAKNYKAGMLLTEFARDNKGNVSASAYVVDSHNARTNKVAIVNDDGKKQFIDAEKLSKKNISLSETKDLDISVGDKLKSFASIYGTDIKANSSLSVENLNRDEITLYDGEKTHVLPVRGLVNSAIDYNYATTERKVDKDSKEVWVSLPHFSASKEKVEYLLSRNPESLRIYSDNKEKLSKNISESRIQPAVTAQIMGTSGQADKYINAQTYKSLKQDLNESINAIVTENNRPISEKALEYAVNLLSEREASFAHTDLIKESIEFALDEFNKAVDPNEIEEKILKNKELLSTEYSDGIRWVTESSLNQEVAILSAIESGKGKLKPLSSKHHADGYLTYSKANNEQSSAIELIVTSKDRFLAVQGFAGTGKSTMLEEGVELVRSAEDITSTYKKNEGDHKFIGMAPTHAAVSELQDKGINALTAQRVLADFHSNGTNPQHKNAVFLLDESSMASNEQLSDFVNMVEETEGARMVWLGDKKQIQSIKAGKPFQLAIERGIIETAYLKDIVRQKSPFVLDAVKNLIDHNGAQALADLNNQSPIEPSVYMKDSESQSGIKELLSESRSSLNALKQQSVTESETPELDAAADYLSRTRETRDNTIVILYSNNERDNFTTLIRPQLKEYGELSEDEINSKRLRTKQFEEEKLKSIDSYTRAQVYSVMDNYYNILEVDGKNRSVLLEHTETKEKTLMFPEFKDHKYSQLWEQTEQPLSVGEKIVWRVTDKDRGIKGNEEFVVKSINEKENLALISSEKSNLSINLDFKNSKDQHWDYAYTKTANLAQGSTYRYGITIPNPNSPLTDYRRAYIDVSRAVEHVHLYTTDKGELLEKWGDNNTDKQSAIDTLEHTTPSDHKYFQPDYVNDERFKANGRFNVGLYRAHVTDEISKYTESLAPQLMGEKPDSKSTSKDFMVFGDRSSPQVKVTLTGEYRGFYRDFATGKRGNMINMIMDSENITYAQAIERAAYMAQNPKMHNLSINNDHEELKSSLPMHRQNAQEYADKYRAEAVPLNGTLSEKLVNDLGGSLKTLNTESLMHHPDVYSSEDKKTHPAMISKLSGNKENDYGILIHYLDSNGKLDESLKINPRNLGEKNGGTINLNYDKNNEINIISGSEELAVRISNSVENTNVYSVSTNTDLRNIDTNSFEGTTFLVVDHSTDKVDRSFTNELIEKKEGAIVIDTYNLTSEDLTTKIDAIKSDIVTGDERIRNQIDELSELLTQDALTTIAKLEKDDSDIELSRDPLEDSSLVDVDIKDERNHDLKHYDFDKVDDKDLEASYQAQLDIERDGTDEYEQDLSQEMYEEYERSLVDGLEGYDL